MNLRKLINFDWYNTMKLMRRSEKDLINYQVKGNKKIMITRFNEVLLFF
jgi:hypothetical protein